MPMGAEQKSPKKALSSQRARKTGSKTKLLLNKNCSSIVVGGDCVGAWTWPQPGGNETSPFSSLSGGRGGLVERQGFHHFPVRLRPNLRHPNMSTEAKRGTVTTSSAPSSRCNFFIGQVKNQNSHPGPEIMNPSPRQALIEAKWGILTSAPQLAITEFRLPFPSREVSEEA